MTMVGLRPPRNKKPAPFPCATAGGGAESEDGLPGRASGNPLPRDRGKEAGLSLGCSSPLPSWKPFFRRRPGYPGNTLGARNRGVVHMAALIVRLTACLSRDRGAV